MNCRVSFDRDPQKALKEGGFLRFDCPECGHPNIVAAEDDKELPQKIFDLADQLYTLRQQKEDMSREWDDLKKVIEETEYRLSDAMALSETPNFTRKGVQFYLTSRLHASPMDGDKDALHAALRKAGFGSLVTESVNHQTLSSFVREQRDDADNLPAWLSGLVKVFEKATVGIRQAKK
jgi:hypothetical protein